MPLSSHHRRWNKLPALQIMFTEHRYDKVPGKGVKFVSLVGMPIVGEFELTEAGGGATRLAVQIKYQVRVCGCVDVGVWVWGGGVLWWGGGVGVAVMARRGDEVAMRGVYLHSHPQHHLPSPVPPPLRCPRC